MYNFKNLQDVHRTLRKLSSSCRGAENVSSATTRHEVLLQQDLGLRAHRHLQLAHHQQKLGENMEKVP